VTSDLHLETLISPRRNGSDIALRCPRIRQLPDAVPIRAAFNAYDGRKKFFQRRRSSVSPNDKNLSLPHRERARVRARTRFAPLIAFGFLATICAAARADIPWPEVVRRLAYENEKLARRPQGHSGEYFVVCTLYYTPMESGFTAARGFDVTPVTKPGLHRRTYPRDFLRAVKKEGFGRIAISVNGRNYIRYNGGNSYAFASNPSGGGGSLVPRLSAAARRGQSGLRHGVTIETSGATIKEIFRSTRWKIIDTGGGLRRWQIDLYWGDDEPRGPGRLMARPSGTAFEYAYSEAKVIDK
jgi:hypothetical protein